MGNYMSCSCHCTCLEAAESAEAAESKRKPTSCNMIMVVHSAEGRVIEAGGGAPLKVAELMLDFPGHFVSACETDSQDHLHMIKRAAPLPADHEALPGRVYILFPMHKLHTRVAPHESSAYLGLVHTHVHAASKKKKKPNYGSKVTPLNNMHLYNFLPISAPPQAAEKSLLPLDDCPSDDDEDIDEFLQQFCSPQQQNSSGIFSTSSSTLVRTKSWIPKLETISESSTLAA